MHPQTTDTRNSWGASGPEVEVLPTCVGCRACAGCTPPQQLQRLPLPPAGAAAGRTSCRSKGRMLPAGAVSTTSLVATISWSFCTAPARVGWERRRGRGQERRPMPADACLGAHASRSSGTCWREVELCKIEIQPASKDSVVQMCEAGSDAISTNTDRHGQSAAKSRGRDRCPVSHGRLAG